MKTQHTPGPWAVAMKCTQVWNNDLGGVAVTICSGVRSKEDAHLIAAAPELLEALENAKNAVEKALRSLPKSSDQDSNAMHYARVIGECESAIKKAKGE